MNRSLALHQRQFIPFAFCDTSVQDLKPALCHVLTNISLFNVPMHSASVLIKVSQSALLNNSNGLEQHRAKLPEGMRVRLLLTLRRKAEVVGVSGFMRTLFFIKDVVRGSLCGLCCISAMTCLFRCFHSVWFVAVSNHVVLLFMSIVCLV